MKEFNLPLLRWRQVNNCVIDEIVNQVKITHGLQVRVLDMKNRIAISQRTNGEVGTYSNREYQSYMIEKKDHRLER